MQGGLKTIIRILKVAWLGVTMDYKPQKSKKYDTNEGYEKHRVVYTARPLMRKEK